MTEDSTPCIFTWGKQLFLTIDKVPVLEIEKREVAIALLAAHYNFSICYPVRLQPVSTFFLRIFVHRNTPWQTRSCF